MSVETTMTFLDVVALVETLPDGAWFQIVKAALGSNVTVERLQAMVGSANCEYWLRNALVEVLNGDPPPIDSREEAYNQHLEDTEDGDEDEERETDEDDQ